MYQKTFDNSSFRKFEMAMILKIMGMNYKIFSIYHCLSCYSWCCNVKSWWSISIRSNCNKGTMMVTRCDGSSSFENKTTQQIWIILYVFCWKPQNPVHTGSVWWWGRVGTFYIVRGGIRPRLAISLWAGIVCSCSGSLKRLLWWSSLIICLMTRITS